MPRAIAHNSPFLLVRFIKDVPVWEYFDGRTLQPTQPTLASRSLPVLALLPDRLFFFFQPDMAHLRGSHRQVTAAVNLQIEQMFPGLSATGNGSGVLWDGGRNHVLGYFHHPDLEDFARRHQDVLHRANAVSTPFFLAWNAGLQDGGKDWLWENPRDGTRAIMQGGTLDYFIGDEPEARNRLVGQGGGGDRSTAAATLPGPWQFDELLRIAPTVGWSALRLPLPIASGNSTNLRGLTRLCLAVALLGVLFSLGQGLRLSNRHAQVAQWEQATRDLYSEVLTLPLGDDPFGRLLFRLDQIQGPERSGPDALAMLGLLSSSAPPDFHVESFSLGPNSGIIKARLANYEQLEALLSALEGQDNLRFDLDQASSAEEDVQVTLRVSY